MFGIKKWEKKEEKSNNKYYIEIKPDTEIIRAENEEQLKLISKLEEVKALPMDELPKIQEDEVCAHWERELVFLSEVDGELFVKTRKDEIVGGYCPDCKQSLGMPKKN